mmetsp:Transcript_49332/g.163376  ORF Transcript_49332/g.163376 Transcript_49332/m.163376 type:complete len:499 (+) Transcript_49332:61-1557(+)
MHKYDKTQPPRPGCGETTFHRQCTGHCASTNSPENALQKGAPERGGGRKFDRNGAPSNRGGESVQQHRTPLAAAGGNAATAAANDDGGGNRRRHRCRRRHRPRGSADEDIAENGAGRVERLGRADGGESAAAASRVRDGRVRVVRSSAVGGGICGADARGQRRADGGEGGGVDGEELGRVLCGELVEVWLEVDSEGAEQLRPAHCLWVEVPRPRGPLQRLWPDVDVLGREEEVVRLVRLLHRPDCGPNLPHLRPSEHVAVPRKAVRLESLHAARQHRAGDQGQPGHRRQLVDDVAVEVVDRGGGAPRVEVGAEGGGADELADGAEVRQGHLLRQERRRDEQHMLWEERELVGEQVVAPAGELQPQQPLGRVADLSEVECVWVEGCADAALLVWLLRLCVPARVQPLAEGRAGGGQSRSLERGGAGASVVGVVHDEAPVGGEGGGGAEDGAEGSAQRRVVLLRRAQPPPAQSLGRRRRRLRQRRLGVGCPAWQHIAARR